MLAAAGVAKMENPPTDRQTAALFSTIFTKRELMQSRIAAELSPLRRPFARRKPGRRIPKSGRSDGLLEGRTYVAFSFPKAVCPPPALPPLLFRRPSLHGNDVNPCSDNNSVHSSASGQTREYLHGESIQNRVQLRSSKR